MDSLNKENLENVKSYLSRFSDKDFSIFITKKILELSDSEIATTQFAFWICYEIEQTLDNFLRSSFKQTEELMGKTPEEIIDFVKKVYQIKFEIVNDESPKYDPINICFNDRIDILEKMFGINNYTKFLRKIKSIRNDLSHGRIKNLSYENESLNLKKTKEKLISDYLKQMVSFDENPTGGVMSQLTPEQNEIIRKIYLK